MIFGKLETGSLSEVFAGLQWCSIFQQVADNSFNYDAWFDYLRLLENEECPREEVEDLYERAIANIPPHEVRF